MKAILQITFIFGLIVFPSVMFAETKGEPGAADAHTAEQIKKSEAFRLEDNHLYKAFTKKAEDLKRIPTVQEFDAWALEIYRSEEEELDGEEEKQRMMFITFDIGLRAVAAYSSKIGKKDEFTTRFKPVWTKVFGATDPTGSE